MPRYLIVAGVALVIAALLFLRPPQAPPPAVVPPSTPPTFPRPTGRPASVVYVSGAVARPGLYRLPDGARVDDAVRRAGELQRDADADAVNLAARVHDGDHITVAVLGVPKAHPSRTPHPRATARPRRSAPPSSPVDVNLASAEELARVPGFGPTLAQRIVALRSVEGPFSGPDALLDVSGMSAARLDRARDYIRFYH